MMRLCQWCLNPYDERMPRSQGEIEQVQQALFLTGEAARLSYAMAICDSCHASVTKAITRRNNASSLDVGSSNHGPPNLLLRSSVG